MERKDAESGKVGEVVRRCGSEVRWIYGVVKVSVENEVDEEKG